MRRKSGFTIVEQAIALVPEFKKVTKRMEEQVVLRGQSISTLSNYIRRIAAFVVHFGKLPETNKFTNHSQVTAHGNRRSNAVRIDPFKAFILIP